MNPSIIPKLGALNKNTGQYVFSKLANKKDDYICPDCNKEIILCKGEIRIPYFRHKFDNINPCNYYDKPSESQIHKDAKMLIKYLLEKGTLLTFIRNCIGCKKNEEFEIPVISENSSITIEYRFEYNGTKIADVAYIEEGDILCIFEICNTHKTSYENRPEPWFEIDALTLSNMVNTSDINDLIIPCIRCEKCEDCIVKEKTNMENKEKALHILYEWLKNGNEIKPFIFDYARFSKIEKNIKSEFTSEIFDLILYLDPEDEEGGWERYCIKLIYDFEEPYFINEDEYVDFQIGIYYIDINWILAEKTIPPFINYIACLDKYSKKIEKEKCYNCEHYGNLWVKKFNTNNQTKVVNVGCLSCKYNLNKEHSNCGICKKITPLWVIQTNKMKDNICKNCDTELFSYNNINKKNEIKESSSKFDSYGNKLIFLNVEFNEKDEIKRLGARFDINYKKWYITENNKNIGIILQKWKEYRI